MKNTIFVTMMIVTVGCYDSTDSDTDTEYNTDDSETIAEIESDTALEIDCVYDGKGYAVNSCLCATGATSYDHYACCEKTANGFGWKWYVCSTGPTNVTGKCSNDPDNISVSCTYITN